MADSFTPKNPNAKGQYAWSNSVSWSTGAPPDQNTAAILNSTAVGYTLLIDGADTANAITFGSGSGWLSIQIAGGDTLKANSGGNVAGGSTVTFAASSAGSFTTNGFEVHAGGTLNVLGGTFSANGSGLTLDDGSNTTFGTGVTLNVNTLNLSGASHLTLNVGSQNAPNVISIVNGSSASSTLTVSGGSLQIGSVSGGTYVVTAGGTIDFAGSLASGTIVRLAGGTIKLDTNSNLQSGDSFAFSGSTASTLDVVSSNNFQNGFGYAVTGFDHGDRMRFGTLNLTGDNAVYSSGNSTLTVRNGGQTVLTLSNLSLASDVAPPIKFNLSGNTIQLACFLSGTLIETRDGAVPVETLRVGDDVMTIKHGARVLRPVRWVGSRLIRAAEFADDEDAYPVRIRADAFAPGLPRRDLLVTGDHGIFVGGGLIPARMLVNGRSIVRDDTLVQYTVHHVEFDTHSIMLAEGLPTESYLDTGNRASFGIPGGGRARLGRTRRRWSTDAAAPLTVEREAVEPVWQALVRRADLLGLPLTSLPMLSDDPELGVLLEDGRLLRPRWRSGARHLFHVPCGARPRRLLSRSARPSRVIGPFVDDRRRLGVGVRQIVLWNGLVDTVLQAADLGGAGWHGLEDGHRWTSGDAILSVSAATGADTFLEVQLDGHLRYSMQPDAVDLAA